MNGVGCVRGRCRQIITVLEGGIPVDRQCHRQGGAGAEIVTGKPGNITPVKTDRELAIQVIARHSVSDHRITGNIGKGGLEAAGKKIAIKMEQLDHRTAVGFVENLSAAVFGVRKDHRVLMAVVHRIQLHAIGFGVDGRLVIVPPIRGTGNTRAIRQAGPQRGVKIRLAGVKWNVGRARNRR